MALGDPYLQVPECMDLEFALAKTLFFFHSGFFWLFHRSYAVHLFPGYPPLLV